MVLAFAACALPAASATKPTSAPKAAPPAKAAAPAKAAPAANTAFYVIRRSEEAWTILDPNAVERVAGGPVRRVFSVTVRRTLVNGGPPAPGYVRTLNEYDCDARRARWRTFTIYSRFGAQVVKQENADPTLAVPIPGSEDETALRIVCDGAGGGSVVSAPSMGQLVIGLMEAWDPVDAPPPSPPFPAPLPPKAQKPTAADAKVSPKPGRAP